MAIERNSSSRIKPMRMHIMDMMGLLMKNKKIRLTTSNKVYNDALDRDIIAAIKRIEKEDSALLEMFYPLSEHSMLHGYMGLKSYLLNLFYENTFCHEYDAEDIEWLINNYCRNKDKDEESAVLNRMGFCEVSRITPVAPLCIPSSEGGMISQFSGVKVTPA